MIVLGQIKSLGSTIIQNEVQNSGVVFYKKRHVPSETSIILFYHKKFILVG